MKTLITVENGIYTLITKTFKLAANAETLALYKSHRIWTTTTMQDKLIYIFGAEQ